MLVVFFLEIYFIYIDIYNVIVMMGLARSKYIEEKFEEKKMINTGI